MRSTWSAVFTACPYAGPPVADPAMLHARGPRAGNVSADDAARSTPPDGNLFIAPALSAAKLSCLGKKQSLGHFSGEYKLIDRDIVPTYNSRPK